MGNRRRARILLASLSSLIDGLLQDPPFPPPPATQDPRHHPECNVNLFEGGRCDCDRPGEQEGSSDA